ncbi:MAG: nucleotidyltransferase domain-containing protein [Bacteroidota bacterium]
MNKPSNLTDSEYRVLSDLRRVLGEKLQHRTFRMVLFGSKARGDNDAQSDIDIAIIVDSLDRSLKNEILDIVSDIEFEYLQPLSVLVFSTQEYEHLLLRERRIAYDIEREGILI